MTANYACELKVVESQMKRIKGKEVEFENGETHFYDHIVFAAGFRSTVKNWLKVKTTNYIISLI